MRIPENYAEVCESRKGCKHAYHFQAGAIDILIDHEAALSNEALKYPQPLYEQGFRDGISEAISTLEEEYVIHKKKGMPTVRSKFARETETKHESYCRHQGFLSGLIVAKQRIDSMRTVK